MILRKNASKKKRYNLFSLATFKKNSEKSEFLKLSTQAFEAGDFLDIFLKFWGF